jgi:threonine dehydrogenase-like Zn-dependent dehydrogenase
VLARFPLADLLAVEGVATRRELAQQFGASRTCTPAQIDHGEADLIYEVSGVPEALNSAIDLAAYDSRIIVGSWYGNKSAAITLGGKAHRHRINISTSQVSTIAPQLSGRWTKARRFGVAWQMLQAIKPSRLITDRVSIHDAEHIYKQIHESPKEVVQAVFVYD